VADFLDVHWANGTGYVFNLADSAIVGRVGLLLLDSLLARAQIG